MIARRRFLSGIIAALAFPASALAQAQQKVYRIGYLNSRAGPGPFDEAFVRGMREHGYTVGNNLAIEYRWAANDIERLQPLAEELARLNVDVIVTTATPAIRAAMRATRTIPIVFAATSDPVGSGLVASLSHPGGNVTGLTLQSTDLALKRLQLLREIVPGTTLIAMMVQGVPDAQANLGRRGGTDLLLEETRPVAQSMGVGLAVQAVVNADDLPEAFAHYRREKVQALIVQANPLTLQHRARIAELAARQRLPALYEVRSFVDDGGFVSYGPDLNEMYRRAASYVDRIFKGAKPGELAVEQPSKLELVFNLKTAKALGLTIPPQVLLRADDVIR
jgi:putative ABC transport system substrate-binding protein